MSYTIISEKCSCGATTNIMKQYGSDKAIAEWRKNHRHEFPPVTEVVTMPLEIDEKKLIDVIQNEMPMNEPWSAESTYIAKAVIKFLRGEA